MPRIALGEEPLGQSKRSTGTTEQSTTMTVWIVRLKGVCVLELRGLSVQIILLLTCGTSTVFIILGYH